MSTETEPGAVDPSTVPPDGAIGGRAARGVAWTALEQWGGQAVGLLVFLALARLLSPEAFGLIAMAGVVVALMQSAVEKSFADAVVQRSEAGPALLDTAFWSTLGFALVAGAVVAAAAGVVAAIFGEPALAPVVAVMALTLPLTALGTTHLAVLRRRLDFRPIALRGLVANVVGGGAAIGVAVYGGGVWSLVVQALVTGAVGTFLLWRVVDWRPRPAFDGGRFRELAGFGGNLVGANLVNFANRYADDFIIGVFLGPVALGYYTVAYRLLWSGTRALTGVASAVAFPAFSRLQHDPARMRRAFLSSVRVAAAVAFPIFAGILVFAPELVATLFGARWDPASPVLRVLALIGFLHAVFYLNTSAMVAAGHPRWVLRLNLLYAVLNVVAFAVAVRWGIVAVAAAYVIRGYVTAPLPLLVLRRIIGLDLRRYGRQLGGVTAATSVMAFGVLGLRALGVLEGLPLLLLGTAVGAGLYAGALALFDREGLSTALRAGRRALGRGEPADPADPTPDGGPA